VRRVWWRNLAEGGNLEKLGVEWKIILKWIVNSLEGRGLD
jgi:hypothetical protein